MRRFAPFPEVFDRRAFVMNLGLWSWDISPARPFPFHNRRGAVTQRAGTFEMHFFLVLRCPPCPHVGRRGTQKGGTPLSTGGGGPEGGGGRVPVSLVHRRDGGPEKGRFPLSTGRTPP